MRQLLNCIGVCNNEVRLPLVKATKQLQDKIAVFIDGFS